MTGSGPAVPAANTAWPVPVSPELRETAEGWEHAYVADGDGLWAGPHLGIYPGIWFAARALAAVAALRGGVPERWHLPRVWFRGAVRPGDALRMVVRRRGAGYWVEHRAEGGEGPPRAVLEVGDGSAPAVAPREPGPDDTGAHPDVRVAEPPSDYELRQVAVASARARLPWVWGELEAPRAAPWMLEGFPAAPGLWMVEALGQLSFVGFNLLEGRRAGAEPGPARYVAGRLAPAWLENRPAAAGGRYRAWMRLAWGGEAAGIGQAAAADERGVAAAMECLFARVDAVGEGPGSGLAIAGMARRGDG